MTKKYRPATVKEIRAAALATEDTGDLLVLDRVVVALFGGGVRGGTVRFEKGLNRKASENGGLDECLIEVSAFDAHGKELKPRSMSAFLKLGRASLPNAQVESLDVLMSVTKGWSSTEMVLDLLNDQFQGEFPPADEDDDDVLIYSVDETPYSPNTPLLYVEAD